MFRLSKSLVVATMITCTSAHSEVMLGAFVPGDGFQRQEIVDFNAVMPKSLAFINLFSSFSHNWDHLYWQTTNIVGEGAMPMISWMPVDLDRPSVNILSEIALGLHDEYLDEWGTRLQAWINQYPTDQQPKILLRFGHEFNGNWYPYGNSPFFFQSAWQYIHDRFENSGVNHYVEWVWSANNVDVDDHDNVVEYYPGGEYVDWTSIDGYNFGSNYSWTEWESFNETYADMYLTLVNNFPEKPILIAEVGSAEESDLPDANWGQFGDQSDDVESKELWIADFLLKLETEFPAVRAFAWFNTNKELNWSLTTASNTGASAYIAGIQSDHFTSDFISAVIDDESVDEVLVALQAELAAASDEFQDTLQQLNTVEDQLGTASVELETAQALVQSTWESRSNAINQHKFSVGEYVSSREQFRADRAMLTELKGAYVSKSDDANSKRSSYNSSKNNASQDKSVFLTLREQFRSARATLIVSRDSFQLARNSFIEARDQINETGEGESATVTPEEVEDLKNVFLVARDAFLLDREDFLTKLQAYRDWIPGYKAANIAKQQALIAFRSAIAEKKAALATYFSQRANMQNSLTVLKQKHEIFVNRKIDYNTAKESYIAALTQRDALLNQHQTISSEHQDLLVSNSESYQAMIDAEQNVSMHQDNSSGLMLSDSSNGIGNGNSSNGNSDNSNAGDNGFSKKALTKTKNIEKGSQQALANSNRPTASDPAKIAAKKAKIKNITAQEKTSLKDARLSVIDY